jgi:hypothetical protein
MQRLREKTTSKHGQRGAVLEAVQRLSRMVRLGREWLSYTSKSHNVDMVTIYTALSGRILGVPSVYLHRTAGWSA